MHRRARIVIPGMPHHVTQRGNNRKRIFFTDNDYQQYLKLLSLDLTDWQTNHPLAAWREALQMAEDEDVLMLLRTTTHTGRPLGNDKFLDHCEKIVGQRLRALKVGRPRKEVLEINK